MKPTDVKATDVSRQPIPLGDLVAGWVIAIFLVGVLVDFVIGHAENLIATHDAAIRADVRADIARRQGNCLLRDK